MPETRLKPFDSNFVNSVKLGQRSILSYLSMLFNRFASFHAKMSAEYTSERRALIDNGPIKLIDDVRKFTSTRSTSCVYCYTFLDIDSSAFLLLTTPRILTIFAF